MWNRTSRILPSIVDAIGQTPLVDLSRLTKKYGLEGRVLAKLEYLNPGFSKKDRIAKQIILEAKESGELQSGQTVVELTSGNTGTGLAIVCGILGHPFVAVMSAGNSMERARMMKSLGADVVLVDQAEGSKPGQVSGQDLDLVEQKTQELEQELEAFRADQFVRGGSARAHLLGTAPEIWKDSGESITAFCDFVGTGGSFGGCASYFQPRGVKCYIIEPLGATVLSEKDKDTTSPNHRIQGGGYMMDDLPLIRSTTEPSDYYLDDNNLRDVVDIPSTPIVADGFLQVSDEEAIETARDLAKYEGIYGGFSGGANMAAAAKLLREEGHKGGTVAILICDSDLKYLSTDLWQSLKE